MPQCIHATDILTATCSLLSNMLRRWRRKQHWAQMPDREAFLQSLPRVKTDSGAILEQDSV
jgi:hypothetical protein